MASHNGHHIPGTPFEYRHGWIRRSAAVKIGEYGKSGGFSIDRYGKAPTHGFMVSDADSEADLPVSDFEKDIEGHIAAHAEAHHKQLADPGAFHGAWTDDGKVYLDVSRNYGSDREAASAALKHRQLAVADVERLRAGDKANAFPSTEKITTQVLKGLSSKEEGIRLGDAEVSKIGGKFVVSNGNGSNVPFNTARQAAQYLVDMHGQHASNPVGPTNTEKIHNAEVMYGTGSKQHKAAIKKFGADLSILTPWCHGVVDLANDGEQLAYWKQVLPKKTIHYTGQDGKRHQIDFTDQYLTDLANNKIVDEVGFLLADKDNRHTMDPERWRGKVAQFQVRDDGLYAKIVFPNKDAAAAVLANPDLGVSARIIDGGRELADGSSVARGIVHVLGTLDPQVNGMSGWTAADLSTQPGDVLDLTAATFEEKTMALFKDGKPTKAVADFTDEEVESLSDEDLELFLTEIEALVNDTVDEYMDETDVESEDEDEQEFEMALSNEAQTQIDLANSRANTALRQLAQARWERERDAYLASGVPPALLDLAAPVLSTTDEFVVDLSRTEGDGAQVNVEKIVRGLLDAAKGTIDLSAEEGHGGTFKAGSGEDPDAELLKVWDETYR